MAFHSPIRSEADQRATDADNAGTHRQPVRAFRKKPAGAFRQITTTVLFRTSYRRRSVLPGTGEREQCVFSATEAGAIANGWARVFKLFCLLLQPKHAVYGRTFYWRASTKTT